ncbi:MAG TPA: L-histidine N(alpha)-methyltransferase [Gemmatimonadaceae bacterium]|nr:L-histidine N(alpha)-methyltransferase [Gemmatimonadaceae bacterium]
MTSLPLSSAPGALAMLRDVQAGMSQPQKELAPKYFYDQRGSRLFEAITELPEYYLTHAERSILQREMDGLMAIHRPASLVELGAGSAAKTRLILDAMRRAGSLESYVPLDVSASFLGETAARLRAEYPGLHVEPVVADFTERVPLPGSLVRPALLAFLGSTIGNFHQIEAVGVLRRVRAAMTRNDRFLLGADLRKDAGRLEAAYNDSAGVTAEFNRNMLRVLNRELGANFDVARFAHRAFFNASQHRIEMHLVAQSPQTVRIPGAGEFSFARGESVRTEISCKYDRAALDDVLTVAGLRMERWLVDAAGDFAVVVAARAADQ